MMRISRSHARVGVAEALSMLATMRFAEERSYALLSVVADLAKRCVPSADEASVLAVTDGRVESVACTGMLAAELDEGQRRRGYGPCLDAAVSGEAITVHDMATETRWLDYPAVAVRAGIHSSLSVALPVQQESVGTLNLYAAAACSFDDAAVELAETFAGYAAVALAGARTSEPALHAEQMRGAMRSRAVVEQAKGVIVGQRRCAPEEAFEILVDLAQHGNRGLAEVAAAVVERAWSPRG